MWFYVVRRCETRIDSELANTVMVTEVKKDYSTDFILYETNVKTYNIFHNNHPKDIGSGLKEASKDLLKGL